MVGMLGLGLSTSAFAQSTSNLSSGLATLVGYWDPIYHEDVDERIPGPDTGDYAGLPITPAARMRADTWDASLLSLPEHQCKPHPSTYGFRGVGTLRIWEDRDTETQQLIKIETQIAWQAQHRYIFMDGRAPPPENAPHTWQGFSKGHVEGGALVVETDRLKAGWIRRNGLPLSDRATMVDRFYRHGNILTHVMIVSDPVYLSEPEVKTNGFIYADNGNMIPYPCRSAVEIPRVPGTVPYHKIGENTASQEFAAKHNLPIEGAKGGAETALPEFAERMLTLPKAQPVSRR
jgi:hypothetical protein